MQIFLQMNELRYWSWLMIDNVNILVYRLTLSILKKEEDEEEEEEEEERERERINPKQCMYLSHALMTLVGTWGIG